MAILWRKADKRGVLIVLFVIQFILNAAWSPFFFYYHNALAGLSIITALTVLVGYFIYYYYATLKLTSGLLLPYFIWLMVATSLNAYIILYN